MQNTEQQVIKTVSNEDINEDTNLEARTTSIQSKEASEAQLQQEQQQQDPGAAKAVAAEEVVTPKVKTRSRFSVALRSLSKSKKDKDKDKEKDKDKDKLKDKQDSGSKEATRPLLIRSSSSNALEQSTLLLSSGGEDNSAAEPTTAAADEIAPPIKKKSKLSRRFLLGSLRRAKVSPKRDKSHDGGSDDLANSSITLSRDLSVSEALTTTSAPAGTRLSGEGVRTVQITISGRKIEPSGSAGSSSQSIAAKLKTTTPAATKTTTTTTKSALSETDYLTPLTTTTTTTTTPTTKTKTTTTTTTTTTTKDKRSTTKVIVPAQPKENNNNKSAATTTTTTTTSSFAKVAALAAKKKKLKPKKSSSSSTTTTTVSATPTPTPTEEKICITESPKDTPPRERAPAKPSRLSATATAASQTQIQQPLSSTGAVRKPTSTRLSSSSKQQQSSGTPSTTSSTHTKKNLRSVATVATAATKVVAAAASRRGDKGLMQSGAAYSQERGHRLTRPTTTTNTTRAASTSNNKTTNTKNQSQDIHTLPPTPSEEKLQPPNYPPPPIPFQSPAHERNNTNNNNDDETRSPAQSLHGNDSLRLRHIAYESVETATFNETVDDDVISSAESAQPTEYSETSITLHTATPTHTTTSGLHFAVGSEVRPPPANAYESALAAATASAQDFSSSDTQSDSSRIRRTQYAERTPSLCDDHDSIAGRRETLHYQSVATEYSYDTDDSTGEKASNSQPMPAFGDLTMDHEMEPTIMTGTGEKREHLYKILVIGELGTGKTSFIKRYVHQFFSQNYRATIGVDFALKVLHWDPNTIVRLQLWDIAGQERFGNMTRVYYKEAVGAFIVFDVTRSGTFDCVSKWKEDLDSKVQLPDGSPIPCILLANKCDQEKQGIVTTPDKMDDYVRENGFAGWFETSAKENINIDEAARALVNKILLNDKLITAADLVDSDKFNLNNSGNTNGTETKSKCAC